MIKAKRIDATGDTEPRVKEEGESESESQAHPRTTLKDLLKWRDFFYESSAMSLTDMRIFHRL